MILPKCERPVMLFNRSKIPIIASFGGYFNDGIFVPMSHYCDRSFPFEQFSPYKLGLYNAGKKKGEKYFVDIAKASKYYTCDKDGVMHELFMLVPCNHCDVCNYKKRLSLRSRLDCEASCWPCRPLFLTLSYRNEYLPECGVSKEDICLFLKRLKYFLKKNNFNDKFRYYLVSEYGHDGIYRAHDGTFRTGTSRPHYHAVFYGISCDLNQLKKLENVFSSAWSTDLRSRKKGIFFFGSEKVDINCLGKVDLQFLRNASAGSKYVSKYLSKPQKVPKGKNKCFQSFSRRPAIGKSILTREFVDYIRNNPKNHEIKYKNFDGSTSNFIFTSYYLNKIFPSYSRQVPTTLRHTLFSCEQRVSDLVLSNTALSDTAYSYFSRLFKKHFFNFHINRTNISFCSESFKDEFEEDIVNSLCSDAYILSQPLNYKFIEWLCNQREIFFGSIPKRDFDINHLKQVALSDSDINERLEIFY